MNRALKKLYRFNKKSLKALNETFHIDYNKPMQAVLINGNTTIKQILKKIEFTNNTLIIVLTLDPENRYRNDEYRAATIDSLEHVEIGDGRYSHYHFDWKSGIDCYYGKSDFREQIKSKTSHTIVIAQERTHLAMPKELKSKKYDMDIDRYERFKISNEDHAIKTYSYQCDPYIDEVKLIETTNNGRKFTYNTYQYQNFKTNDISNIIDKSGYIVELKRLDLLRGAKELKAERAKNAFMVADFSKQLEDLRIRITAKKLELIELLKNATTADQFKAISDSLDTWNNGYAQIVESFDRMQAGIKDKTYRSIDDFNDHYNRINQMLLANGKDR